MHDDGIKRFIENITKQQEAWNKLVQPYAEMIQRMNAQMAPYLHMAEKARQQMEALAKISEPIRTYVANMQASLEPVRDMVRRFVEQRQALKEHYRKAQDHLSEEGWYLGSDMPLPNYSVLAKMVDEGQYSDIEDAMCQWARSQIDGIITGATKAFPSRAQILKDAADAHREGKYSLSVPAFFAQSDGMANDIIGNCLFRGNPPKALEKTLSQFAGFPLSDLSDILLDPLRSRSRFYTCSPRHATKGGVTLANRSEVMHGAQLDYASEANSLRGIVLLGYLVGVKSLLESHSEHVAELQRAMDEALASSEGPEGAGADGE